MAKCLVCHASAPGKVHLIGEHAVVYNQPAIIAAISQRCRVSASPANRIEITSQNLEETVRSDPGEAVKFLARSQDLWNQGYRLKDFTPLFRFLKEVRLGFLRVAVASILQRLQISTGVKVEVCSEMEVGAGLGSSAAAALALSKAISCAYGMNLYDEQLNSIAHKIECFSHGTPSGGDDTTCCLGGSVWFQKTKTPEQFVNKNNWAIREFFLVFTGTPTQTTGEMVQLVRNLEERFRTERIQRLGELAREMRQHIFDKCRDGVIEAMNRSHQELSRLGVSTPKIDTLASLVRQIGGGAKLSGAGGGGFVLCLHGDREKLAHELKVAGYPVLGVDMADDGVRLESTVAH